MTDTGQATAATKRARRRRFALWAVLMIMLGTLVMPMTGYLYVSLTEAYAAEQNANPRANYWRDVREGNVGYTAASGPYTTNALIQNSGQNWRAIRNGPLAAYGAGLLALAVVGLIAFHLIFGAARLEHGRSGNKIYRWNVFERVVHWYVAVLFIILAITGLSLLYGRAVLIPVLGLEGFAAYASVARPAHDYLGLFFVIGLVVMLLMWAAESLPFRRHDWEWFKKGGGYFKNEHAPAGRVNAGEKIWFWLLLVGGVAVMATGLVLDFPNLGFERSSMQLANVIHASAGILLTAAALGHIYLGTVGNEGTFEGMVSGYVDENWARQHHSIWYEQVRHRADREEELREPPPRPRTF